MSVKFSVQMTDRYMYDFMLYNHYTQFSGLLSTFVGILSLANAIVFTAKGSAPQAAIWYFLAAFLLVVTPISMRAKAKMQVAQNAMFRTPLEYELNEEGVVVRQGEQEAVNPWDSFMKAVSTQKSVILYITKIRAIVLPKACMGEQYEEVLKAIHTHMPAKKVKIKC